MICIVDVFSEAWHRVISVGCYLYFLSLYRHVDFPVKFSSVPSFTLDFVAQDQCYKLCAFYYQKSTETINALVDKYEFL